MHYAYIALIAKADGSPGEAEYPPAHLLQALDLEPRGRVGCMTVFAPEWTPTLALPDGSMIIGDLYGEYGSPIWEWDTRSPCPRSRELRQHLLEHYWGEYLLLQPPEMGDDRTTVMRDPTAGVACAYSLQGDRGFMTSDLSIASRLGLYQAQVDWDFVRHCLVYPHLKTARTGLAGVSELLPGCTLATNGQTVSIETAWSPWRFVAAPERLQDFDTAAQTVRDALVLAVETMAYTDGDILLELSGGLDSSIVGACLEAAEGRLVCCTAVTPLPGADERRYAGQVAAQLGVALQEQMLDFEGTDIDFPLPTHSLRPAVWVLGHAVGRAMDAVGDRMRAASHYSGSGGDTVFGYLKTAAPAADAVRERGMTAGYRVITDLARLHGCTLAKAARLTARKLSARPKPPCKPNASLLCGIDETLAYERHPWHEAPEAALPGDRERIFDLASNQLFMDATLRAGGRRVRMPLLSQPVMEACLRAPAWMWIAGGRNRAVVRAAFSKHLPADVLNRRSKGSFLNYTFGIYVRNKPAIREFLLDGHLHAQGLIDARALDEFLGRPFAARDRSFMRVFDLCMIENWVRNHA